MAYICGMNLRNFFGRGYWNDGKYRAFPTANDYANHWGTLPAGGGFFNFLLTPLAYAFGLCIIGFLFKITFLTDMANTYDYRNDDAFLTIKFERDKWNDSLVGTFKYDATYTHGDNTYDHWQCESNFIGIKRGNMIDIQLENTDLRTFSPYANSNLKTLPRNLSLNLEGDVVIDSEVLKLK